MPEIDFSVLHTDTNRLIDLAYVAAVVHHATNNAFSGILMQHEMLREHLPPGNTAVDRALDSLKETCQRAPVLIMKHDEFARSIHNVPVELDLRQLVGDAVSQICQLAGRQVAWQVDLEPVPTIRASRAHVIRLLQHLLFNAVEAIPGPSGTVSVRLTHHANDGLTTLSVRDSGPPVADEFIRMAPQPYFTTKPNHIGIGLTVARSIGREFNAFVNLVPGPGGTCEARLQIQPID